MILAEMQQPFPALTFLQLGFQDEWETVQWPFAPLTRLQLGIEEETALVVSTSFRGGSAPLLQSLILTYLPFPGLPNLLLSTTHLVRLVLRRIPHSGFSRGDGHWSRQFDQARMSHNRIRIPPISA